VSLAGRMVPEVGLEPTRRLDPRGILSPIPANFASAWHPACMVAIPGLTWGAADPHGWQMCEYVWLVLRIVASYLRSNGS
jgi:hypothetical protein